MPGSRNTTNDMKSREHKQDIVQENVKNNFLIRYFNYAINKAVIGPAMFEGVKLHFIEFPHFL